MSNRRALKPIDQEAARAADEAIAAETGGRPLTMGREDAALRERWMDAYVANGGKLQGDRSKPAVRKPDPTDPVQPCPKRLEWIRLITLHYETDHGLLKDEETQWTNTGDLYPTPHWEEGMDEAHPISHNMDEKVDLQLTFEAGPEDACAESGDITGIGPDGIQFNTKTTIAPGTLSVRLTSNRKLPREVAEYYLSIDWTVKTPPASYSGNTGGWCYLTMDDPREEGEPEDGVTRKRISKAVTLVQEANSLRPHSIVNYLMKLFPFYELARNPVVPNEIKHPSFFNNKGGSWNMADYMDLGGECQAIVRFVRGILLQVGCPGKAEAVVVWADPNVESGTKALEAPHGTLTLHGRRKQVNGVNWYISLADRDPVSVGSKFTPDEMGMNNFEACLRFTHSGTTKYYGGGAGIYDSHDEVIHAFHALVWHSFDYEGSTLYYVIQEIVQRYR
ncbi:MAG: hypothetical protein JST93_06205 [Acidobacteria bacterium]|nr:hypothetical protein [Acidobacteriota bacterium]